MCVRFVEKVFGCKVMASPHRNLEANKPETNDLNDVIELEWPYVRRFRRQSGWPVGCLNQYRKWGSSTMDVSKSPYFTEIVPFKHISRSTPMSVARKVQYRVQKVRKRMIREEEWRECEGTRL